MARKKRVALTQKELENQELKKIIYNLKRKHFQDLVEVPEVKWTKYKVLTIPNKKEVAKVIAEIEEELGYEAE